MEEINSVPCGKFWGVKGYVDVFVNQYGRVHYGKRYKNQTACTVEYLFARKKKKCSSVKGIDFEVLPQQSILKKIEDKVGPLRNLCLEKLAMSDLLERNFDNIRGVVDEKIIEFFKGISQEESKELKMILQIPSGFLR